MARSRWDRETSRCGLGPQRRYVRVLCPARQRVTSSGTRVSGEMCVDTRRGSRSEETEEGGQNFRFVYAIIPEEPYIVGSWIHGGLQLRKEAEAGHIHLEATGGQLVDQAMKKD